MKTRKHPIFQAMLELMQDREFLERWLLSESLQVGSEFGDDFPPTQAAFDSSSDCYMGLSKNQFLKKARLDFEKSIENAQVTADGKLVIYRSLQASKVRKNPVGVCWAWEKEMAMSYWSSGSGKKVLLKASVSISDIDLEYTTALALNPFRFEREIRLKSGRSIEFQILGNSSSASDLQKGVS